MKVFSSINAYAPVTTKTVRADNHHFMTKALLKAILTDISSG